MRLTIKLHVVTRSRRSIRPSPERTATCAPARSRRASECSWCGLASRPSPPHLPGVNRDPRPASAERSPPIQSRKELAAFFREQLPQSHEEGLESRAPSARGAETWRITRWPTPSRSAPGRPSTDHRRRRRPWSRPRTTTGERRPSAPASSEPSAGRRGFCSNEPGKPCDSTFIHERPKDEGHAPITLRIGMHAEALDEGGCSRALGCATRFTPWTWSCPSAEPSRSASRRSSESEHT